jgi:hypothetical protein
LFYFQFEDEDQIAFSTDRTLHQFEATVLHESEPTRHALLATRSADGNGIDILDQEFSGLAPLHVEEAELHTLLLANSPELISKLQDSWASQIHVAKFVADRCVVDDVAITLNRTIDFPKILPLKSGSGSVLVKLNGYQQGHFLLLSGKVVDPFASEASLSMGGVSGLPDNTWLLASGLNSDSSFAQSSMLTISLTVPQIKTLVEVIRSHEDGVLNDDSLMDILFTRLSLGATEESFDHVGTALPLKLDLEFFKTYCSLSGQQLGLRAEPVAHRSKPRQYDILFSVDDRKKKKREESTTSSPRDDADAGDVTCLVTATEATKMLMAKGFTSRAAQDILLPASFSSLCSALKSELKFVPDSRHEALPMCLCTALTVHTYALTVAVGKVSRNNVIGSLDIDDTTTLSELRLKIYTEFEDEDLFPESFRFQFQGTRCSRNQEKKRFAHHCLPTVLVVANSKSRTSNQSRVNSFDGADLSKHNDDQLSSDDSDDDKGRRSKRARNPKSESVRPQSEGKEGTLDGDTDKAETSKLRQRKGVVRQTRKRNMRKMRWIERMQKNADDKLKHQRQLEMNQPPEPPPPPRPTTPPPVYIEVPLPGVFTPLMNDGSSSMVNTSEDMGDLLAHGTVVRLKEPNRENRGKLIFEGTVETADEDAIIFTESYTGTEVAKVHGFKVIDQKDDVRAKWKVMFDNKHPSSLPSVDYDEAATGEKFFGVFWHHSKLEQIINELGDGYLHMKREDYFPQITSEFISQTLFDLICSWYPASENVEGSKFAKFSREFKIQGPMLKGTDIDLIFSRVR